MQTFFGVLFEKALKMCRPVTFYFCLFCLQQVARCTKIINAGLEDAKYVINVRQIAKFVVGLGEKVGHY